MLMDKLFWVFIIFSYVVGCVYFVCLCIRYYRLTKVKTYADLDKIFKSDVRFFRVFGPVLLLLVIATIFVMFTFINL